MEELQSVGLQTGGTQVCESHEHDSLLVTAHTDPVMRLWTLNSLRQPIKRFVIQLVRPYLLKTLFQICIPYNERGANKCEPISR